VAEPGSRTKLSKRKLDKYLKNRDFASLVEHGRKIAEAIKLDTNPDTFNPVITDFYEQVGYLPEALINYLALLGWSLDDRSEDFSREELIANFSLERVNKAPASFDPKKLMAFQERHMLRVPLKQKVEMVLPYLVKAGHVAAPVADAVRVRVARIVEAAGDRIKVAGDIINFSEFFVADEAMPYDEKEFDKAVRKEGAAARLARFRDRLADAEPFDAPALEALMQAFVAAEAIKPAEIVHAVRVAVTGKSIGMGLFDSLAILGKGSCLRRIGRTLQRV
jgi:glutamyl-tRNA synthetase